MINFKEFLIDAIIGGCPAPIQGLDQLTQDTGNQHNFDIKWKRDALNKMPVDSLKAIYTSYKPEKTSTWEVSNLDTETKDRIQNVVKNGTADPFPVEMWEDE
jgi:hypothetical protein